MDISYLGVLDATSQTAFNITIGQLEDLHIQAIQDLSILADQGINVDGYKAELDALGEQITLLKASIMTMEGSPEDIGAWRSRAESLDNSLRAVLARTGSARTGAPELAQLRGLGWGLGVLAAATLAGAFVWVHRRKRRR